MKISTKGRYGLEAMVDLAIHGTQGCVNIKSIAARCEISEAYVLQIFLELRRAGIIESIRGAQGGYILAKEPSHITVNMVLTALEGKLAPVACLTGNKDSFCDRNHRCGARTFWTDIMNVMVGVANSITIEDLVLCYNQSLKEEPALDYFI
jgi:Rrf2 family protein